MTTATAPPARWTDENILDLIRKIRNDLVKDFLDDRILTEYLRDAYNLKEVNSIKLEFIRRDLKEYLIHPVDTAHYDRLIHQIRSTDTASLSEGNDLLFYKDIDRIIRRYLFASE